MNRRCGVQGRRRAHHLGLHAESLAVLRLRLSGWKILARRYRCPIGEIDIAARRADIVAILEVKARDSLALALESVTARQKARILRATEHFRARRPDLQHCCFRFDVMAVVKHPWPYWIQDAWRP